MIKTIIFDFGGVLVDDLSHKPLTVRLLNKLPKKTQNIYWKVHDQSELGKDTYRHFLEIRQKYLFPNKSIKELEKFYLKTKILPSWKLAQNLSKRYRVIIFSNNARGVPNKIAKYLNIDISAFPFVNSANVGMRKPQSNYYGYLIKKIKLNPSECVFIDDQRHNLVPAKKLGIKTFLYKGSISVLKSFFKKSGII